jgi:hypothetical protein
MEMVLVLILKWDESILDLYWVPKSSWGLDAGNYSSHQFHPLTRHRTGFLMHRVHPRWRPDQHPGSLETEVHISQLQVFVQSVCRRIPNRMAPSRMKIHLFLKTTAFWGTAPCSLIVDQRFRDVYCLHHQANLSDDGCSMHL